MQINIDKGLSFYEAFKYAKEMIDTHNTNHAEFDFNEIYLTVYRASVFNDIATIYELKCEIRRIKG